LPPNTLAEMRRDMARLRFVIDQIKEIEVTRLRELEKVPNITVAISCGRALLELDGLFATETRR